MIQSTYGACSIELDDHVIVTGGKFAPQTVDVYNMDGWVMDFSRLTKSRLNHGCGHYINADYKMVYLVTGGGSGPDLWSSTETLVDGASAWTSSGHLPVAMQGLRGVSLNNKILMTGGSSWG